MNNSKKILNIPNILAGIRIIIVPFFFFLLVSRDSFILKDIHISWLNYFTAFLFVLASITDFFDGYIARTFNQVTNLGKIIDPLADKMLTLAGFLGLMILNRVDEWIILLILTREMFIAGLRISAIEDKIEISVSWIGKIKTVVQMIAIGFLIMEWQGGELILWLALLLTLYSGYEYSKEYFLKI